MQFLAMTGVGSSRRLRNLVFGFGHKLTTIPKLPKLINLTLRILPKKNHPEHLVRDDCPRCDQVTKDLSSRVYFLDLGARIMFIFLPSSLGMSSTRANSSRSLAKRKSKISPCSLKTIERPRKNT